MTALKGDAFTQLLPLLRRTFARFSPPERRQIGQRVKQRAGGLVSTRAKTAAEDRLDVARAESVLPILAKMLGLAASAGAATEER